MAKEKTGLQQRIESGKPIVVAEISPPTGSDAAPLREVARRYAGKVHALGISDNRDRVCMSALAAASLVAAEGVEPLLHVVTRDRNRIALISDCLGAEALGVRNLLCTSGTHQTLGRFRAAKNVFDVDSIQLLKTYAGLGSNGELVGEEHFKGVGPFCLGAVATPLADPMELQVMCLAKKVAAGARFFITQPVFDLERLGTWLTEVVRRGIHEKAAILAGIRSLRSAEEAKALAEARPSPRIPDAVVERMASAGNASQQRAAGIEIALETIERLSAASGLRGLRGFQICGDSDPGAALEIIEKSGLGTD
ncbi:MAG TPA: methylenetetrahydrofolate reductase [Thermoguttaceae bacterium]|nr:methylenetetrahydrofolate reductase [Thermoguttaceae bacterium]